MGTLKGVLSGAIATIGILCVAPAYAEVVTVTFGSVHGHFAPWTYNVPIEWVNSEPNVAGAGEVHTAEANPPPSDHIFGVELPEVPTWLMLALGFAGLGFAAFRSPRKRRYLFS